MADFKVFIYIFLLILYNINAMITVNLDKAVKVNPDAVTF
jgi:hypothetical protein